MSTRLRIALTLDAALAVERVSIGKQKLAYVICIEKKWQYNNDRSRIVYIGTTKNGISRVAESAASHSEAVLSEPGINRFSARIVSCTPRQNIKTWHKLERALILQFKEMFGEPPVLNTQGKNFEWRDEKKLFSVGRLATIIEDLS